MSTKEEIYDTQIEPLMAQILAICKARKIAGGEIQAKPGEVAERTAWLVNYIRTGEGLVTDEGREIAARVRAALAPVADVAAAGKG